MDFHDAMTIIHSTARRNGFWDDYDSGLEQIDLRIQGCSDALSATEGASDPSLKQHEDVFKDRMRELLAQRDRYQFNFFAKQIAMIHSEGTELLEAIRKDMGKLEVEAEVADILIRVLDLYAQLRKDGYADLSPNEIMERKMNKNAGRERLHGVRG